MPYRAVAAEALERWRDAQRRLERSANDSPAWQQAYLDEQLAKAEYQAAFEAARAQRLPEPPTFEDATSED